MKIIPGEFKNKSAMTLVEMLIVVSIVAILSGALYKSLAGGLQVWQRANEVIIEEDVLIFFEKFNHDLNNIFPFSKLSLLGNETSFVFPTIVKSPLDKNSIYKGTTIIDQPGMVEYYYDINQHSLMRRQANYSQSLQKNWGAAQPLVPNVKNMKLHYIFNTDRGEQESGYADNVMPSGVEIEINVAGPKGERQLVRYFTVPAGN